MHWQNSDENFLPLFCCWLTWGNLKSGNIQPFRASSSFPAGSSPPDQGKERRFLQEIQHMGLKTSPKSNEDLCEWFEKPAGWDWWNTVYEVFIKLWSCAQPNCTVYSPQGPGFIPSILLSCTACFLYRVTHLYLCICSKERGIWDLLLWKLLHNGGIVSFQLIAEGVPLCRTPKCVLLRGHVLV